MHKFHLR